MARHLGPDAARTLTQGLTQLVLSSGTHGPAGAVPTAAAAGFMAGGGGVDVQDDGDGVSVESILRQRATHAARSVPRQ